MKKEITGKQFAVAVIFILLTALTALHGWAQQASAVVPRLVQFGGNLTDVSGKALTGTVGVTFSFYNDQQGGTPLWFETQNVVAGRNGYYSVQLGSTKPDGLPTELFSSGEARWLGVQPEGQAEQPRVLLLSVPYALKAGDAQTLGGLPASAFVLANSPKQTAGGGSGAAASTSASTKTSAPPANPTVTGKGTVDYIPMWDTASDIVNSVIFQKGSGIGIGTTTPAATLDVNGKGDIRDTLTLFPKGTDPTLAVSGTAFKVDQTGKVTFITGQTFPGTGTITGVTTASGSGLSGGGTSGTLSLKVPSAGITNAMLQNSKITLNANTAGGLTTPGAMTLGSTYTVGLKPCSANQVLQYSGTVWNCASAGTGTITGVTTASGSGLSGGGTSGTLSLKLLGTCTANQILKWSGSAWACAADANSGGTVTSVGVTAPVTDFTVSGSPVTSSGTLNLAWNIAPTSADTASAIVKRDASGNFSAGTINATILNAGFASLAGLGITSSSPIPTYFYSSATDADTVWGVAGSSTGNAVGVEGETVSSGGSGVYGTADSTTGSANGVYGVSNSPSGFGVVGFGGTGIQGRSTLCCLGPGGMFSGFQAAAGSGGFGTDGVDATGGSGDPNNPSFGGNGVVGTGGTGAGTFGHDGSGGIFQGGSGTNSGDGIVAYSGSGSAGYFGGDIVVTGTIYAGTKDFKIDHPLDPANKYLVHASVESSEMMNIYTGNVTTDAQGEVTVQLPDWFEVLNTDFRYQLTVIGQFAQAIVGRKIENNRFEIKTNVPNVEVSWQVTGVRQDAYAKAHPLVVEEEKETRLRGFYIHPELHGAPNEKQIEWARHPQMMKRMKEQPVPPPPAIKNPPQLRTIPLPK
jgi:hypothetical protein